MAKQKIKVIREEMLQVANNVAEEKNIEKDEVFGAMELALEKAARVKYGFERDIRVKINRDTGDINLGSYLKVVEKIDEEEEKNQILIQDAIKIDSNIKINQTLIVNQPNATFRSLPGSLNLRSKNITSFSNFFLAGDWTNTGWPSTMESAAISGIKSAEKLLKYLKLQ